MKTILPLLIALSITTGLASQVAAAVAADATRAPYAVATTGPNDPPFGSQQWWDQESDRG